MILNVKKNLNGLVCGFFGEIQVFGTQKHTLIQKDFVRDQLIMGKIRTKVLNDECEMFVQPVQRRLFLVPKGSVALKNKDEKKESLLTSSSFLSSIDAIPSCFDVGEYVVILTGSYFGWEVVAVPFLLFSRMSYFSVNLSDEVAFSRLRYVGLNKTYADIIQEVFK